MCVCGWVVLVVVAVMVVVVVVLWTEGCRTHGYDRQSFKNSWHAGGVSDAGSTTERTAWSVSRQCITMHHVLHRAMPILDMTQGWRDR